MKCNAVYSSVMCSSVELSLVHGGVRYLKKSMLLKIALSHTWCLELGEWSGLLDVLYGESNIRDITPAVWN